MQKWTDAQIAPSPIGKTINNISAINRDGELFSVQFVFEDNTTLTIDGHHNCSLWITHGGQPNDPSSPTAASNAKPTPEAESAVGCSGLLGQSNQPSIGAENQSSDLSQQPLPTYLSRRIHLLRDDVQLYRQSGESSSVPLRPFPTQISEMKKWAIQLGYENDVLEAYFQSGWFEKLQARSDWPNDPSSPTAASNAKPTPEAESAVGCSEWLGDEETKLRNSIDRYMAEYLKRNLQSPQ